MTETKPRTAPPNITSRGKAMKNKKPKIITEKITLVGLLVFGNSKDSEAIRIIPEFFTRRMLSHFAAKRVIFQYLYDPVRRLSSSSIDLEWFSNYVLYCSVGKGYGK